MRQTAGFLIILVALVATSLGGCSSGSAATAAKPAAASGQGQPAPSATSGSEQPVAPEKNPPGDIPDSQVFVRFTSTAGGYALQTPEGWARSTNGPDARFTDKLDGVQVALTDAAAAPTAATARAGQMASLERSGRAVQVGKVQDVQLPGGNAVLVEFTSNSEPDPVTGKQVRLENNAYLFFKNGKLATLTLWAPLGADNVDQWQLMAESFRWQ